MTVSFLAVLLYVLSGQVVLEQIPAKDVAECQVKAGKRIAELNKDPRLDTGLFAACVPLPAKPDQSKYNRLHD